MASLSDEETEYLTPGFDPTSLTVPRLRAIFVSHDIQYPASAKKAQLIQIFNDQLVPRSGRLRAARTRIKRTSRGIADMPSSQEETPAPRTRTPSSKRASKQARILEDEAVEPEETRPALRKSRRSVGPPAVKQEEPEKEYSIRPSVEENPFTDDNPFQSGSSPLVPSEGKRKSVGPKVDRKKSTSGSRKTEMVVPIKQEVETEVSSRRKPAEPRPTRKSRTPTVKAESDDPLDAGEEFTPEEQQALIQEGAARGEVDVLSPSALRRSKQSNSFLKSAPLVVIMTLLAGYAWWWRKEKIEVGYCGIGKQTTAMSNMQVPDWATILQPNCELCPPHAFCYTDMEARCEPDFVMKSHPLSLGGLIPLVPSCEPDGEKVRKVKAVADKAVEELRDRRAKWECGTLMEKDGKGAMALGMDEQSLKAEVSQKRRRGMSGAEFEELWRGALDEIKARDEVTAQLDGESKHTKLSSSSHARLPLGCAIRRAARETLVRHRVEALGLVIFISVFFTVRNRIQRMRSDGARVPQLVSSTLDRLATQAALHTQGASPEPWISMGQMRDDVLRNEFSIKRREEIWNKVQGIVERNANVRASVREGRSGDVSRVWEWVGSVGALDDSWLAERGSGGKPRPSLPAENGKAEMGKKEVRKWDEGQPYY